MNKKETFPKKAFVTTRNETSHFESDDSVFTSKARAMEDINDMFDSYCDADDVCYLFEYKLEKVTKIEQTHEHKSSVVYPAPKKAPAKRVRKQTLKK